MQPSIGRNVHYQRQGQGQCLHANITRVERRPGCPSAIDGIEVVRAWLAQEQNWDVWLAVFLHAATIGSVEFSPAAVPYSDVPADKCWSWPPRVP